MNVTYPAAAHSPNLTRTQDAPAPVGTVAFGVDMFTVKSVSPTQYNNLPPHIAGQIIADGVLKCGANHTTTAIVKNDGMNYIVSYTELSDTLDAILSGRNKKEVRIMNERGLVLIVAVMVFANSEE